MSADRLREAAKVLRKRAKAATPWHEAWEVDPDHPARVIEPKGWNNALIAKCVDYSDAEVGIEQATYIATMHPGVGVALADWLDAEADERRWGRRRDFDAEGISDRIVDLILGGTP